ncbi:hypothetical protein VRC24_13185 [Pseudomonas poae]|uniref:hypothetical protein n=1 Tax=Pseudomonas poae TaxID=200451 RepID=UPI0030CB5CAE
MYRQPSQPSPDAFWLLQTRDLVPEESAYWLLEWGALKLLHQRRTAAHLDINTASTPEPKK